MDNMAFSCHIVVLSAVACGISGMGDIHTSVAQMRDLLTWDGHVVELLKGWVQKQQRNLDRVQRYIDFWSKIDHNSFLENPVNSYHFLRRLASDFPILQEDFLKQMNDLVQLNNSIHSMESDEQGVLPFPMLPVESDVNGAAWSIVKLQITYNLAMENVTDGKIRNSNAIMPLSADDCLRFGQQSFTNLEFDHGELWTEKGIEMLQQDINKLTDEIIPEESADDDIGDNESIDYESKYDESEAEKSEDDEREETDFAESHSSNSKSHNASEEIAKRIENIRDVMFKRRQMKNLITKMVKNSDDEVLGKFSGLGVPTKFHKEIYAENEHLNEINLIDETFARLCRGEIVHTPDVTQSLKCAFLRGRSGYRYLMPFKAEILWLDPILLVYHDVISDKESRVLQELAYPNLETTQVHSFTDYSAKKSLARVGKTAWVRRGDHQVSDRILNRIEEMSGLTSETGEDFHILNYGVGGHYDSHVDFFDLYNKNISSDASKGDRLATVLFYLNEVGAGGSTVFPVLGVGVAPLKGSALVWFNLMRNGRGDFRTIHASCPVLLGTKWIANLWLHEYGQEFKWPCSLYEDE